MFVSSYSSYVQPDVSSKESRQKLEKPSSSSSSFSEKLAQKTPSSNFTSSLIPIDYISRSQTHTNKQELEFQKEQFKNSKNKTLQDTKETLNRFTSNNVLTSAKNAYENNNKIYSVFLKQSLSIDQTPKMDTNLPIKAHEAKDLAMRHKMVNTYIANDNYYRITA